LAEYERYSGANRILQRARVFQVTALVRMAVRAFKRSPYRFGSNGSDSVPIRLLQEADACLASPLQA
jgi:hypothetical protein